LRSDCLEKTKPGPGRLSRVRAFYFLPLLFAATQAAASAPRLAVWSEFLPLPRLGELLPSLQRQNVAVYVALHAGAENPEEIDALWNRASELGVELRPWLLLDASQGYWANKWNADQVEQHVRAFVADAEAHGRTPQWITLDLEPPPRFLEELSLRAKRFDLAGLWKMLARSGGDGTYCQARDTLRSLVKRLHARGIRVHAVASPFALHDRTGAAGVQNALGIPVADVDWDEVSFMVYRPEFSEMIGKTGADVVYAYSRRARQKYGDRAAIDLGEAGAVSFPQPKQGYADPRLLQQDIAAAQAAGIERINVYSLDGITTSSHDIGDWLKIPQAARPKKDIKARLYIKIMDLLASLLPQPHCDP
jgi:hypothetical protein